MKFELYEMVIIIRAILSADEYLLGIKDDSDRIHSKEQLEIRNKFIFCCQKQPAIILRVQGIVAKLQQTSAPIFYKETKRKK